MCFGLGCRDFGLVVEAFSLMHKVLALCCSRFNIKITSLFGTVSIEMRQHVT